MITDPLVLAHARALLTPAPGGACDYVDADVRDTAVILDQAARTLDFAQPAAVLLLAVLHFVPDTDDPAGIVKALAAGLAPGSYIAISHLTADGPWLLIPFGVLALLLPYGRSRNFGLFSIFLTPLVVVLIDLLAHTGWTLATDRLIDTLLGCGVALLVGYAPWPMSWHAHLPGQFATAVDSVGLYAQRALLNGSPGRSRLRRQTHRALSDLRTEFQRTMAEPPSVSRRAAVWWPALVGLENVADKVTATAVGTGLGGVTPSPDGVQRVGTALAEIARAVRAGDRPALLPLPDEEILRPVAEAVREVQRGLGGQVTSGLNRET
jgi:S-adenosyl methyltransferase/Fusaric acid resistance protein-like